MSALFTQDKAKARASGERAGQVAPFRVWGQWPRAAEGLALPCRLVPSALAGDMGEQSWGGLPGGGGITASLRLHILLSSGRGGGVAG